MMSVTSSWSLILKVAELCNLKCSYCYMYEHADTSYLARPKFMTEAIFRAALMRTLAYCDSNSIEKVDLTFHGGEPLLIGEKRFRAFISIANELLRDRAGRIGVQTNGVLISAKWIDLFRETGVRVSVSLDGPKDVHDTSRVDHAGKGSYERVVAGVLQLQNAGLLDGILSVIHPGASGLKVYRFLRALGVTRMDFLLPDCCHDSKQRLFGAFGPTPVADYLIPIFDAWIEEDEPAVRVRILRDLILLMLGGDGQAESFGNQRQSYFVIDSDGSIQANDALKVCADGIADSGFNVLDNSFDQATDTHKLLHTLTKNGLPLCGTCLSCQELSVCGGGFVPHRYSLLNQFDNPSVWCKDILALLSHMRVRIGSHAVQ